MQGRRGQGVQKIVFHLHAVPKQLEAIGVDPKKIQLKNYFGVYAGIIHTLHLPNMHHIHQCVHMSIVG